MYFWWYKSVLFPQCNTHAEGMVSVSGLFKALQMIFGNWHFWSKYHKMTDVCHHDLAKIIMNTNIWGFIFTALCKGMLLWHSSWSWTCLFVVHLHNHWMKSLAATLSIFRSLILVLKSPSHVNNYIFALIWMFMLSVLIFGLSPIHDNWIRFY